MFYKRTNDLRMNMNEFNVVKNNEPQLPIAMALILFLYSYLCFSSLPTQTKTRRWKKYHKEQHRIASHPREEASQLWCSRSGAYFMWWAQNICLSDLPTQLSCFVFCWSLKAKKEFTNCWKNCLYRLNSVLHSFIASIKYLFIPPINAILTNAFIAQT